MIAAKISRNTELQTNLNSLLTFLAKNSISYGILNVFHFSML